MIIDHVPVVFSCAIPVHHIGEEWICASVTVGGSAIGPIRTAKGVRPTDGVILERIRCRITVIIKNQVWAITVVPGFRALGPSTAKSALNPGSALFPM